MFDPEAFGQAMGEAILKAVAPLKADIETLRAQLKELSERQPTVIHGKDGAPGKDGTSVTIEDVRPILSEALESFHAEMRASIDAAIKSIPTPKDGKDGQDGKSVTTEDVAPIIRAEVEKAVAAIPAPKDGKDGKDGVGLAGAMVSREGHLIVTLTNGEAKDLGQVCGRDGADFTEFSVEYDGERTLTIKGKGGDIKKRLPVPVWKGYWRQGMAFEKDDVVTYDGNAWIALKDTSECPGPDKKEDWRLFVRRGRDGEGVSRSLRRPATEPIKLGA